MLIVRLRAPVLIMVLAATAIPVAFRPPQQPELLPSSIEAYDVLANIAGFVPVARPHVRRTKRKSALATPIQRIKVSQPRQRS
jgi:hypothetical protein